MSEALIFSQDEGTKDGISIVRLTGPLTLTTMFTFQNEFRAMKPEVLVLDLSGTPYMDSAGLGLIMNYYVSAENNGRKILLAAPNERIKALLEMTKVNSILKSYPSVEAAEESL